MQPASHLKQTAIVATGFATAVPEAFERRLSAAAALGGRPDGELREMTRQFADGCRQRGASSRQLEDAFGVLVRAHILPGAWNAGARRAAFVELLRHWSLETTPSAPAK